MNPSSQTSCPGTKRGSSFQHTLWSQVFAAGRPDDPGSAHALERLCRAYWYPIYVFLRRWGHDRQDARDLTQGFFVHLLEDNVLQKADPGKGRFRSFLLGSLRLFVSNEETKERALKRGGGREFVPIDVEAAEGRYAYEPATWLTPEKLFDRGWALEVIAEAMRRLESEYRRAGLADVFALLQPYLVGDQNGGFADLALQIHKTEGAARVLICRLRNRFRRAIRSVIASTVSDAGEVEIELRELQAVLRDSSS